MYQDNAKFNKELAGVLGITPAIILNVIYELTYNEGGMHNWVTYSLQSLHTDYFQYMPRNTFIRNRDKLIDKNVLMFRIKDNSTTGEYNINYIELNNIMKQYSANQYSPNKNNISNKIRQIVFERDLYRCVSCATHLQLSVDHIIPESLGGSSDIDNLQTLCLPCNLNKGQKLFI